MKILGIFDFIRFSSLTEAEQKAFKTMYLGRNGRSPATGPVNKSGYSELVVPREISDTLDFRTPEDDQKAYDAEEEEWQRRLEVKRQEVVSDIDDAIKNKTLIVDRQTQDSLMAYIIDVVDDAMRKAIGRGEFDGCGMSEEELFQDLVSSAYNSLVHKAGGNVNSYLLPDPNKITWAERQRRKSLS